MELHNDISKASIKSAKDEMEKYFSNRFAIRETKILNNDGMVLRIPEDNFLDKVINTLDGRRVILEKKSSIIHDYYSDSKLGKDFMKDYLSTKSKYTYAAHALSLGLISTNIYSKVFFKSAFLGKVPTVLGLMAIQSSFRYLSNNKLENQLSRPWKIHTYRMENGLGPTNSFENLDHPYNTFHHKYSVIYTYINKT